MKIFKDNSVYVQKNDLAYLSTFDISIPASIYIKFIGSSFTFVDDTNRYEFIRYDEESEVEFFRNLDFIVDYNETKDLDDKDIMDVAMSVKHKQNDIAETFNSMSKEEKEENQHMVVEHQKLDYKFESLRDILWFKQGHIKMVLPEGVDYPAGSKFAKKSLIEIIKEKMKRMK